MRVTLSSICTSDLHIKHGSVPRAVPGITVGHEMVGVVESIGSAVTKVKPGDRVTVNFSVVDFRILWLSGDRIDFTPTATPFRLKFTLLSRL